MQATTTGSCYSGSSFSVRVSGSDSLSGSVLKVKRVGFLSAHELIVDCCDGDFSGIFRGCWDGLCSSNDQQSG